VAARPPVIKIPPAPSKSGAKGSPWQQFVNYWASHGYNGIRANAAAILSAARAEHIDPVTFGALLLNESGANFQTGNSRTGAVGIGQLEPGTFIGPNSWTGGVLPWDHTHQITAADLRNPAVNLRLAAAYAGYLQGQYPADWYGRYNAGPNAPDSVAGQIQAGFEGKWISKWNPKYVPSGTSTAPPSAAGPQVPGGTAPQAADVKDPWLVKNKDGSLGFVAASAPPKNAVLYGGTPLTRSEFNQVWKQSYQDTFFAYTGHQAKAKDIIFILGKGWSVPTLANYLADRPTFTQSPVYKKAAPGLVQYARTILGQNWKPSGGLIREAIAQNWDQSTFYAHIKTLPAYQQGPEFKTNLAQNQSVFESVYGTTSNNDPAIQGLLKQKTLAGWTPDEFKSWLEAQPAYKHTAAYQSKAVSFLSQMGLLTGEVPTLSGDQIDQALSAGDELKAAATTGSPTTTVTPKVPNVKPDIPPRGPLAAPNLVSEHGQGGGFR